MIINDAFIDIMIFISFTIAGSITLIGVIILLLGLVVKCFEPHKRYMECCGEMLDKMLPKYINGE